MAKYVTLVTQGGTPVRLANQTGTPWPTTGTGALVFANGATLTNTTFLDPIYAGDYTFTGNLTVEGDAVIDGTLTASGTASLQSTTITGDVDVSGNATVDGTLVVGGATTLASTTASSVNKLVLTAPATTATLTLNNNSTLTTVGAYSQTLTFTGTTNVTFPTSGTLTTTEATTTVIDTISDLRALIAPYDTVFVREYYTGSASGGGGFWWDAASTETDNGGTIIKCTSITTGRFKRFFASAYNTLEFGAVADAVFDTGTGAWTGTDNTAAFRATFLAAAADGKDWYCPTGNYIITGSVCLGNETPSGMEFYGDGDKTVIIPKISGQVGTFSPFVIGQTQINADGVAAGNPTYYLTEFMPSGSNLLPISTTSGLSVGVWAQMMDLTQPILNFSDGGNDGIGTTNVFLGQAVKIIGLDDGTGSNFDIVYGTYNSATGQTFIRVTSPTTFANGSTISLSGLTGTGALASLEASSWTTFATTLSGPGTTDFYFTATTGLGVITITGGTVEWTGDGTERVVISPATEFNYAGGTSSYPTTATGMADNGAGLIRVTVPSVGRLSTGQSVTISGTVGTTEANGTWVVTKISSTQFDLVGSAFVNPWVSGGTYTFALPTTCLRTYRPEVNNIAFRDMRFSFDRTDPPTNSQVVINAARLHNTSFTRLSFSWPSRSISANGAINGSITHCNFTDGGAFTYCVVLDDGASGWRISDCYARGGRHFTQGGLSAQYFMASCHVRIENSQFSNFYVGPLSAHGYARDWVFENNEIWGGTTDTTSSGLILRGLRITSRNNRIIGCDRGVVLSPNQGCILDGGEIINCNLGITITRALEAQVRNYPFIQGSRDAHIYVYPYEYLRPTSPFPGINITAKVAPARYVYFIESGTYNNATGAVSITLTQPFIFNAFVLAATGMADNGAGLIRVTVADVGTLETGQTVTITGTVGTTEANGTWYVTRISDTTFDLNGSAFANAWVSGGSCATTASVLLDQLTGTGAASSLNGSYTVTSGAKGDFTFSFTAASGLGAITIDTGTVTFMQRPYYGDVMWLAYTAGAVPPMADTTRIDIKSDARAPVFTTWEDDGVTPLGYAFPSEFSTGVAAKTASWTVVPYLGASYLMNSAPGPVVTATGMANNGGGLVRVTVAAVGALVTGDTITISGTVGTVEANGTWVVTKISATQFDLVGSAFVNAWVSGGSYTSPAPVRATLPASADVDGMRVSFKKINTGGGVADILPSGSDTIEGVAAAYELADLEGVALVCNDGGWWIVPA